MAILDKYYCANTMPDRWVDGIHKYFATVECHSASEPGVFTGTNFADDSDFEVTQGIKLLAAI